MDQANILRQYGLFDAKVPRYTSYPPANRFEPDIGTRFQSEWLKAAPESDPVSLYIHIPFCRRLCWFCACRTQGTKTLGPVENYINVLLKEIDTITDDHLPAGMRMQRLHLGGGTPTLLNSALMTRLLDHIHNKFKLAEEFEFSVEIDPTDAMPELLKTLAAKNMTRASIGVQDFAPEVQNAIGRIQGLDITQDVIATLRENDVNSLNIDLLYGLPLQTNQSLLETLDQVISLNPDRIALYGYAHVPHVSKRQVMIPNDTLPYAEQRFVMSQLARDRLIAAGYVALGIDHFALPHDSLAIAAQSRRMSRNFQGYTDDPCKTLIGFGASAISKFQQGYVQNAVSTSAYAQRVQTTGTAAHKGIVLTADDRFIATLIEAIMCNGEIRFAEIEARFPDFSADLSRLCDELVVLFPDLLEFDADGLALRSGLNAASRLVAAHLDRSCRDTFVHSLAI